jgi:hypothetical protein
MRSTPLKETLTLVAIAGFAIVGLAIGWAWYNGLRPTAPTPSATPRQLFDSQVTAVLDRRCSNCHGVSVEAYQKLETDPNSRVLLRWPLDESGRISSEALRDVAYERCTTPRTHGSKKLVPIDPANATMASEILIAPLSETYAGTSLNHPPSFATPDDPDFAILHRWVEAEIGAAPASARALDPGAEQFFAEQVVPVLVRKTCFGSNCHGALAFNDLKLHPGVPLLEGRFTVDMHRTNRLAMLGRTSGQTRMVHLAGDIEQSRQLLKNIPISQGGILHKGGNEFFEKGDPDYEILVRWLALEAAEARRAANAPLGEQRGLVFVRRPRDNPQRYFEDDAFTPGADLFWHHQGAETNLTADLHPDGPADIRAPDVSYDARRIVFAMRRSLDEPLNIWELELETRKARQLTFSSDSRMHFQDPQYAPDPRDASGQRLDETVLLMVSNLSGEWAVSSPEGILGEAEGGDRWQILDTQLTEKPGSYDGRAIRIVRGTNRGQTRRIEHQADGRIRVDAPFDAACDSTTHYVIEVEPRISPSYDLYRMQLATAGMERQTYEQTLSRRSFGLGQIRRPNMRSSGEIMFTTLRTGWQSDRPFYNAAVFRAFHNGANYHTHYGNRSVVPILSDNRELPNGLEIRVGRNADSYWGGALLVSDHQFGVTIDPANPNDDLDHPYAAGMPDHSMHQFFRGWVSLDERVNMRGLSPGGAYRDPYYEPDGSLLVAYAPGPLDLADPEAAPDFDIIRLIPDPSFQVADSSTGGRLRREVVVGGTETSELWPRPVVVRAKERLKKKLKWATDLFGEPHPDGGFPGYARGTPAQLMMFDLVLLDAFFEQSVPVGEKHLRDAICPVCGEPQNRDDQVRYARVIGAKPLGANESGPPRRYIIAELPLEKDGSFHVAIPSEVAFDVQSLNAERMALRSPNRWLYALPGEKHTLSIPRTLFAQTCGGCHGTLSGEHTNTFGRPDAITSASRTLAVWDDVKHENRPPANYDVAEHRFSSAPFAVGFEEDIEPIVVRRCVGCHGGAKPAAGLGLDGDDAFEQLRRLVDHRQALAVKSYLIETLLGRELSAPRELARSQPHPENPPLDSEELRQLIRWIDLGAARERTSLE